MSAQMEVCPDCQGAGDIERGGNWETCEWCAGTGLVDAPEPDDPAGCLPVTQEEGK